MSSSNFWTSTSGVAIDGLMPINTLASHAAAFKGALYLCPDEGGDNGVEGGGFPEVQAAFKGNAVRVPVVPGLLPPAPFPAGSADENRRVLQALALYTSLSDALNKLNYWEAGTLISCKSNRRAGMVYSAVDFVQNHLSDDLAAYVDALRAEKVMTFVDAPAMLLWFTTVAEWHRGASRSPLELRQLFEKTSSTYTYLVIDSAAKECVLIDPVKETAERDAKLMAELGLTCKYALNTHVHADHITGTGLLKQLVAPPPSSAISAVSQAASDVKLADYSTLVFGHNRQITAVATPGHTEGCMSFVLFDKNKAPMVFTGDALLIRGCGRTDFQGGSAATLYDSVHSRLFSLPESCIVYPAHNYDGLSSSTIGEERTLNPRLSKDKQTFIDIMAALNLPKPAKIDEAVPANLACGV